MALRTALGQDYGSCKAEMLHGAVDPLVSTMVSLWKARGLMPKAVMVRSPSPFLQRLSSPFIGGWPLLFRVSKKLNFECTDDRRRGCI